MEHFWHNYNIKNEQYKEILKSEFVLFDELGTINKWTIWKPYF